MSAREETRMQIPKIDMSATGQNIRIMMANRRKTVRDVQRAMGLASVQAVYKWLYGQSLPTIDNLVALAFLLDVKIDDIVVTR